MTRPVPAMLPPTFFPDRADQGSLAADRRSFTCRTINPDV